MTKALRKVARLYYIVAVTLSEPIFYFKRKVILKKMSSDWFNGTEHYLKFQNRQLLKIMRAALNTRYYRKLQNLEILSREPDLSEFPLVDKRGFKNNTKEYLNRNCFIPHSEKNTGGSTGEPFSFQVSFCNRQLEYIHQKFFYSRVGYQKGDLIYSFGGIVLSQKLKNKNIYWKSNLKNFPFGKITFSANELNSNNSEFYIEKILKDKPAFLRGYPSALEFISNNIIEKNHIKSFNFLKGIMITSETISKNQIDIIGKAFNCPILPQYGMTESAVFAFTENNKLSYYCSPYYGVTEVIKPDGSHAQVGEIGELVLTSLGNRYQPFIRYRSGDLAIYGGVKNGFTILKEIIGRSQDYIFDSDGQKIMLVGLIFGSHSKVFDKIKIWQIVQNTMGEIEVRISAPKDWTSLDDLTVRQIFKQAEKISVDIIYTTKFILTKAGKRKFVIQRVPG